MIHQTEPQPDENTLWDHLALPAEVREQLRRAWCAIRDGRSESQGRPTGPNLLIWGPPGTGKTEITRAFGRIPGVSFLRVCGPELRGGWIGQSAQRVREVFSKARSCAPSVLCIDLEEGPFSDDCVFPRRGSPSNDSTAMEIIVETLIQMDGCKKNQGRLFIVGEVFNPEDVDPAILARFDWKIEIPLPDDAGRRAILKSHILDYPIDPNLPVDEVCARLSEQLPGKSGRDLRTFVRGAVQNAVAAAMTANEPPENVKLTDEILQTEVGRHRSAFG